MNINSYHASTTQHQTMGSLETSTSTEATLRLEQLQDVRNYQAPTVQHPTKETQEKSDLTQESRGLTDMSLDELKKFKFRTGLVTLSERLTVTASVVTVLLTAIMAFEGGIMWALLLAALSTWWGVVAFLSMKRRPLGRTIAIVHYAAIALAALGSILFANGFTLMMMMPLLFLGVHIEAKKVFQPNAPSKAALAAEIKKRQKSLQQ
ncbi:hypothetical protein [Acanthopleuribacter pedis]|uniref:Uncharacterized protein n=1 Tax=Acanthopleuribacter pedis TaxID=442870 RepID=A0A8J7QB54_9BACT|nr:hypothetical protein [Acanthopleuribacter pedis]MBO1317636.1 hypothetical protein [Acanthopleuribacter pedis]